ncbi:MAG: hypothetical protein KBD26_03975 [Candidatus Pacebacteria bacterium]|nr:hypothetical protein [Candidatus Paceibacterota bacterium]MBP9772954.1 hypothetical protein [Candidatus Paceibacterota bacterium]QQR76747.1 MAG: hypothetical protein IPJ63_00535 [Candidatus Nomurabacteria bacterium]
MQGKIELEDYKKCQSAKNAALVVAVLNKGTTALALGISKPLEKEIRDRAKKYVNAKNAIMKWLGAKTPTNARLAFAEINKCKIKDENIVRDFAGTLDGFGLEEMKRMSQKDMPSPQEAQKQEAEQQ